MNFSIFLSGGDPPQFEAILFEYVLFDSEEVTIGIVSTQVEAQCSKCKSRSKRIHSRYIREPSDLPVQGFKVTWKLKVK